MSKPIEAETTEPRELIRMNDGAPCGFGQVLRAARLAKRQSGSNKPWTQQQAAAWIGCAQRTYQDWEYETKLPAKWVQKWILRALGGKEKL